MSLKDDIIRTVEYAESYHCRLTKRQVIERLIGKTIYLNPPVRLNGHPPLTKGGQNSEKLKKAKYLANILSKKFKNILFIGVTGSVAAETPKENDDIDLFIIVRNNTLWLTRFWVRLFVIINKIPHRKYGKPEHKDEFCFNMWLDESALELPKNRQNLRNAVDMVLMKKVYDKENTYLKFLKINKWVKKYTATPYHNLLSKSPSPAAAGVSLFDERGTRALNFFYFIFQYLYLKMKRQRDTVDLHRAMWGKGDNRS